MYNLKITALSEQRDMPSLIKVLLKIPGLRPREISSGLKVPPLNVLSTEKEEDAQKLKSVLEKLGAVCAIENAKIQINEKDNKITNAMEAYIKRRRYHSRKFRRNFWFSMLSMAIIFAIMSSFNFSASENKQAQPNPPKKQVVQNANIPNNAPAPESKNQKKNNAVAITADIAKINSELKKNPYNAEAWKNLADNLEKQGDSVSARKARESFEKSVKAQQVLSSLAKAFGNKVRVEIKEDAVYYRTSYDFTDDEFYAEAGKLMDSLTIKFPGKNMVIENYTSDNRVQSVQLESRTKQK